MDRRSLVIQDFIRELQEMRAQIEIILNRKEKYFDPGFAVERTSGRTLWNRWDNVAARITIEFPEFAKSVPMRKHPAGWEKPLDREDLKSMDRDIVGLIKLLKSIQNK